MGFVAQEIQKVLPALVTEGADKDKLLSINYIAIIPVLVKAIQEQQSTIAAQQTTITMQQATNAAQQATNAAQQAQIDELKKMVEGLVKR